MKLTESSPGAPRTLSVSRRPRLLVLAALAVILLAWILGRMPGPGVSARLQTFVTIFLGIFIEAVPFLLAGSLVSGVIEVFVDRDALARLVPRRPVPAALAGALLGLAFPVCECGVVPVTRRLYQKGLPLPVGIAFLLAAPVVNPVVILSTAAAFGWGTLLWGRLGLSILIPFLVGLLFGLARPQEILREEDPAGPGNGQHDHHGHHDHQHGPSSTQGQWRQRLIAALNVGGDDFLDMARYLIVGSMLAAAMQSLVPQAALLALGERTLTSVATMMALAFILSICSTVDAFVALSFVNSFPPAAVLAFLVFGPMVDIKSALMFLGVFRRRVVLYLVLLPLLFTLTAALLLHLQVGLSW